MKYFRPSRSGEKQNEMLCNLCLGQGVEEVEGCIQLRWGSSVAMSKGQDPFQKGCHQGLLGQEAVQRWLTEWREHIARLHPQQKTACLFAR